MAPRKRSGAGASNNDPAFLLTLGRPWIRAVAAGALLAASVPPWGFWPLGIVGMAIWAELLTETKPHRRAALSALVSVSWLAPATVWMLDLTLVGWPLAVAAFAAMHAAAGALVPPDRRRRTAFPAALALAEFLRWSWPFGGVPLATMAMGQVSGPAGAGGSHRRPAPAHGADRGGRSHAGRDPVGQPATRPSRVLWCWSRRGWAARPRPARMSWASMAPRTMTPASPSRWSRAAARRTPEPKCASNAASSERHMEASRTQGADPGRPGAVARGRRASQTGLRCTQRCLSRPAAHRQRGSHPGWLN